jgi:hypothetical protein
MDIFDNLEKKKESALISRITRQEKYFLKKARTIDYDAIFNSTDDSIFTDNTTDQ